MGLLCQWNEFEAELLLTMHIILGDKPYSCSGCGASFTQGSSLKLHIRSRHDENMAFFSLCRKPGKNNLTKLWTRVVRLDANVNLPVAQSSLYILPPQQLLSLPLSNTTGNLTNGSTCANKPRIDGECSNSVDRHSASEHASCGKFSVEALASPSPLRNSTTSKSEDLGWQTVLLWTKHFYHCSHVFSIHCKSRIEAGLFKSLSYFMIGKIMRACK